MHWVCENQAPSTLVNFGFTPKTFKPGDVVTVVLGATSRPNRRAYQQDHPCQWLYDDSESVITVCRCQAVSAESQAG